jgi:threonine dehydrogenase-like Zn-dependent dehydrogenase
VRAVCWDGRNAVRVETVPDPAIVNPRDAIVRVRATSICGSDLHLYDGYIPTMAKGDILGHEFMGEIVEVGPAVDNLSPGDRVIVPSMMACGACFHCRRQEFALCDNSNPTAWVGEQLFGQAPCGFFGYSRATGGYAGSFAEYVRVPFADFGPRKVPPPLGDEQALFISDAFPTGYMGADLCDIEPGDTVAVWGCGAVGLFAIRSAYLLGAGRVIAIDRLPDRLRRADEQAGAETIDYTSGDVVEALKQLTGGRGPDACVDAVGLEAHKPGLEGAYDRVKQALRLETDRPYVIRDAIQACRKGGTISIMGVYGLAMDKFPIGAVVQKGLRIRAGLMHAHRYMDRLVEHAQRGDVDPSFVATHRLGLEDAPRAFETFKHKRDNCLRVILTP